MSAPLHDRIWDAVGIGAGPFNLGFAALAETAPGLEVLVLERAEEFAWHPGMMLEGTHLQVPFMADLVTMADPAHPLSFLNHLKDTGRLYPFYIRENFYPLREEYNNYLRWAAKRLDSVRFGAHVAAARHVNGLYELAVHTGDGVSTVRTRRLVLGTGTTPHVPDSVPECVLGTGAAVHSSGYRPARAAIAAGSRIAVVGSGQSAAEVFADLLASLRPDQHLEWVTRSARFFPLEYTKLTLEMTSPEYIDHFHGLPQGTRDALSASQKGLYKGINADLIDEIHELLYRRQVSGHAPVTLRAATALQGIEHREGALELRLRNQDDGGEFSAVADTLVLATGYAYREPGFLAGLGERINRLADGRLDVDRSYAVSNDGDVLVQNAELHTHGFTAPDLGMGAYRNSVIINRILGYEHYAVEKRIGFQSFGSPAAAPTSPSPTLEGAHA
ncbi:lysine N(6)-hydroxylase/L-ornithine N(5)-oxygenase family protein [Paeniglutamicibacter psychrophenolicus]|uniref:lysine N(6)-hydroxylase/L-ornithine N(5)-oxygenase family protein n=1 Tax=Paeniglutamicibacter psychrophenolicus TaxID=257454 RepID=UPI0027874F55|nr:SidA/IucD/PvdA family monooxygenase [Paeniglutamicibacter psychrophenolicus]MDQ0095570.1 lysine N6-hydroxylase [Paeniglutamicibacter psychrophenolicus]